VADGGVGEHDSGVGHLVGDPAQGVHGGLDACGRGRFLRWRRAGSRADTGRMKDIN
jgi:hypothetical protein